MALIDTSGLALYDEEYVQPIMNSIAPTESGVTSAHDYTVGQEFYHNNLLYKAKTAIETGDTLVVGTNIEPAQDISTQLFNSVGGHITIDQQTYDSLPDAQKLDPGKFYYIDDAQGADYDNIRDIVAPTEYAAGAAEARAKGDEFIVGDNLLRATQAIAANTPIAVGTNAELAGTIVSQLKALFDGVDNVRANMDNPNLLDNPWFTVNQRGESSYPAGSIRYTVDRWRDSGGYLTITINSDGSLTIANNDNSNVTDFLQYMENNILPAIAGKKVTASVMLSNGTVESGTVTIPSTIPSTATILNFFTLTNVGNVALGVRQSKPYFRIVFNHNTSATIKAVKLEIGEISTLAEDTVPNYEEELAKCQRYFVRYRYTASATEANYTYLCYGHIASIDANAGTLNARCILYLPVLMRTSPTVTMSGSFALSFVKQAGDKIVSAIAKLWNPDNNIINLQVTAPYGTLTVSAGDLVALRTRDSTNYLDFSADL